MVALWPPDLVNNLLLTGSEIFSRQVKHIKILMPYLFSHTDYVEFFNFFTLKLLAKTLASAYDFAVKIVMLINITNNKTHNIHGLV